MQLFIVAMRDIKADVFTQPQYSQNLGSAVRAFGDMCLNQDSGIVGKHPEDFELYHLGYWDDGTGKFTELERPLQIAVGSNYRLH